jgi:phosphoribosylaminoimidazole-succinocarboxamide synthase
MPDTIEGKGSALCVMGAFCFEELEKEGIKTHYRGVVDQTGRLTRTHNLHEPTNIMEIDLVRVIHPSLVQGRTGMMHDYSSYTPNLVNFLIPLEVIYRNSLPQGSSIFKRLKTGEITPSDLGLNHTPREGEDLKEPFFDLSTKLEERDRYLSFKEAKEISGIRESELQEIKEKLRIVNNLITKVAVKAGLKNEDGKIELAFDPKRELMVVDVVGTP